jgi:hypothetical protein
MKLTLPFILLFLLASCKEESKTPDDCIMPNAFNEWRLESFKDAYTIQFPEYFIGIGMQGFEGNLFERYNPDSSIMISYSYCNALYCSDFGDTLSESLPESIFYNDSPTSGQQIELINKRYFCAEDQLTGVLYYSDGSINLGKFYMRGPGGYLEAASIQFAGSKLDTVCLILSTINERISAVLFEN